MFELTTEASLLATFRYVDRRRVELSRDVTLPMVVNDYVTWAFGKRVFLVFALPGAAPRGIVFESNGPGPPVSHMCDWCQQVGLGARVGLLTARRNRERTAGVLVCSDLGCRDRLEYVANRAGVDVEPATRTLLQRMGRFADTLEFDRTRS
jgi:hypothetical protein